MKLLEKLHNEFQSKILGTYQIDFLDKKKVEKFLKDIKNKEIDILINNAGTSYNTLVANMNYDLLYELFEINYFIPVKIIQTLLESMIRNKFGRIINISSIASERAARGLAPYSSSKAAIEAFSRNLACEMGFRNILINNIAPGFVDSAIIPISSAGKSMQMKLDNYQLTFLKPKDISEFILLLLELESLAVNGQSIKMDQGVSYFLY